MKTLVNSCRNMQMLLFGALFSSFSQLGLFYKGIARGKKSVLTTSLGLLGLYLFINWTVIGICEILWLFQVDVALKKSTFFMILSPFFIFACYCVWQMANSMQNKILRLITKAAAIGYLYITVGSIIVSSGVLPGTRDISQMNSVVYPLKVEKSATALQSERFENSVY